MTPDDIVALAARLKALEQIAYAADIFLRHVKGFHIMGEDGQPVDMMNESMPEAIALQQALDAWHQLRGQPEKEQAS